MAEKHLFVIDAALYRAADIIEIRETFAAMAELGLASLPYQEGLYIRVRADGIVRVEGKIAPADPNIAVTFGPFDDPGAVPGVIENFQTGARHVLSPGGRHITPVGSELYVQPAAETTSMMLVVLLATKNVERQTKTNKMAKLGIGKKNPNRSFASVTTINVAAGLPDDPENSTPGAPKLPHFRRGHIRRQHFGPGRQFEKKIWIQAVMVNADAGFVNARRAYHVIGGSNVAASNT